MRATLDGISLDDSVMVEIKCPYNLSNHYRTKETREVPEIYWPQVQHQLKVKELQGMFYLSYNHHSEDDSIIIEVARDDAYISKMLKEEEKFWECLKTQTPPPLTDRDYVTRGPDWSSIAKQRLHIRDKVNDLKKQDKELLEKLIILSEGKNSYFEDIKFTKFDKKGSIDYELAMAEWLEELQGAHPHLSFTRPDLENYRKNSSSQWKLTCSGDE
jgi:predicted phage-related endonuclease